MSDKGVTVPWPKEGMSCDSCWFSGTNDQGRLVCRRNPPETSNQITGVPVWPRVRGHDWCGEWRFDETGAAIDADQR
jgi:hypothetical protein